MSTTRTVSPARDLSLAMAAIIAGVGLLLEAVTQPIAVLSVFPNLIVPGDAATTASNIRGSAELFRIAIGIVLGGVVLDMFVAWALYVFFRPAKRSLSLIVALFRLMGATFEAVSVTLVVNALLLLEGSPYGAGLTPTQVNGQALLSLGAFTWTYDFGLIFFGLHLILLGYLVFQSGYLSRLWGAVLAVLLAVAGAGYVIDNVGKLLLPGYAITISTFTFVGEVVLLIWLLIWGRKVNVSSPATP